MKYIKKYTNLTAYDADTREQLNVSLISDDTTVLYSGSPQSVYIPEHNILSPHIDAYWDNVHYSNIDDATQIASYQIQNAYDDYYVPYTLKFGENRTGRLVIWDLLSPARVFYLYNQSEITLYNLFPDRRYFYRISPDSVGTSSSDIYPSIYDKSFTLTGARMYYNLTDAYNVRDFGGMIGEGGKRIKYGKLIRGSALSVTDYNLLTEILGAVDVYDFRVTNERTSSDYTGSNWHGYALSQSYYAALTGDSTLLNAITTILQGYSGVNRDNVVYIECVWGAHRTGVISSILQGLAGVSFSEIAKDFELTSFDKNYPNPGTNLTFNGSDHSQSLFFLIIRNTYDGSYEKWALAMGISLSIIDKFKENVLEDYAITAATSSGGGSSSFNNIIVKDNENYPVAHPDIMATAGTVDPSSLLLSERFNVAGTKYKIYEKVFGINLQASTPQVTVAFTRFDYTPSYILSGILFLQSPNSFTYRNCTSTVISGGSHIVFKFPESISAGDYYLLVKYASTGANSGTTPDPNTPTPDPGTPGPTGPTDDITYPPSEDVTELSGAISIIYLGTKLSTPAILANNNSGSYLYVFISNTLQAVNDSPDIVIYYRTYDYSSYGTSMPPSNAFSTELSFILDFSSTSLSPESNMFIMGIEKSTISYKVQFAISTFSAGVIITKIVTENTTIYEYTIS